MKVKQLITELKKMPQNAEVYWADHDQGEWEHNDKAGRVDLVNLKNMPTDTCDKPGYMIKGDYVLIRP